MTLFIGRAQEAVGRGRVEEMVLVCAVTEHIRVVQNVQVRRAARRVLCGRRIDVNDALLAFLNAGRLAANLVVADKLDANLAICAAFDVAGPFQRACAFDQKVACVEACRAKFQCELGFFGKALFIGGFGCCSQVCKCHCTAKATCCQQG